jgi:acyl-coenzyme A synthetase/AMP-(fatty) acid ligase
MTQEITLFHWIPTAFRHFVDTLDGGQRFPRLRWLVLGSEPLLSRDVELYKRYFAPGCTLVNRFGSTETGNICWYFINQHTPISHGVVPVGYAIDDIDVLLLDKTGQEGESHASGEIAVKSRYLSPGYWRQSDCRPAASAAEPTMTDRPVYRTGDIGYMLPDGCLVHLGRKDLQVKIRGHRVEVEEVERALLEHSAITDAAVVVQATNSEEKRLVAFCVMAPEVPPTSTALRSFVETRLPAYMVPAAFVRVASLPLTPSGKVDRQALAGTLQVSAVAETPRATPRTPLEKTLVDIWSKALGVSQVGIHDNFFDLGGHSLLASTIIARVAHTLGVEITFRDFFEAPTVAHLAAAISCNQGDSVAGAEITDMLTSLERLTEDEVRQLLDSAGQA